MEILPPNKDISLPTSSITNRISSPNPTTPSHSNLLHCWEPTNAPFISDLSRHSRTRCSCLTHTLQNPAVLYSSILNISFNSRPQGNMAGGGRGWGVQ
ncbi:hypothetical protein CDAR_105061 [Caerostris darwini]|uniref:Uncharacterized protein n=1 Tax=Caerostris darwini TaxID=1538125 RepID=A0AAV4V6N9_9ARAC|nr:hypothetical protein CDAR_105061 [Caerostris darwini]